MKSVDVRLIKYKTYSLQAVINTIEAHKTANGRAAKYTPVARRENKPNAIAWLVKIVLKMSERQIAKLVGSTTPTVIAIKIELTGICLISLLRIQCF